SQAEHREAVHRRVQAEETLEHRPEEEHTSAGELLLVQLEIDPSAACEREPVLRDDSRERRRAAHADDAVDLLACDQRIGEVVETQRLAQRFFAGVDEGQIVERQLRDESPRPAVTERWLDDARRLDERRDLANRTRPLELEIAARIPELQ